MRILYAFLAFLLAAALPACGQTTKEDVLATARRVNNYFMAKHADPTAATFVGKERPSSLWTRGVYYEGLMSLIPLLPDHDRELAYALAWARFHRFTPRNGILTTDADDQCCGQTYLALLPYHAGTREQVAGPVKENLDHQMATGRHDYWTWIDAIQMAMPLYAQTYRLTGDRRYLDYAMDSYRWTRDTCGGGLFNEAEGLWWRDAAFVPPYKEADGNNCYWSRGNGWVYAALVRVMDAIGKKDKRYKELKKDFILMSKALLACQRGDGLWNVSLASPQTFGGKETTGSALFLYGMSWGISHGLLKAADYRPACERAWQGLAACVHRDGFLGYVQGTGKEPKDGQPVTGDRVPDFEDFGIGCFLLGATAWHNLCP